MRVHVFFLLACITTFVTLSHQEAAVVLDASCTCLEAAFDYLSRNPDVDAANIDPVYHFQTNGSAEGRKWNCSLCGSNARDGGAGYCNCSDAISFFLGSNYGIPYLTPATAFNYWITEHTNTGVRWHCDLCAPFSLYEHHDCTCLVARADYVERYQYVAIEPVYHYETEGRAIGLTWNCGVCKVMPHYIEESVCNCTEAITRYLDDHTGLGLSTATAFEHYLHQQRGNPSSLPSTLAPFPWQCSLCSNNVVDPSSSLICNCSAARGLYNSTYNSNPLHSIGDPWSHYITLGKEQGNIWDCSICNDTCTGAISRNTWAYASQYLVRPFAEDVTIPAGCVVLLESALELHVNDLFINGVLRCNNSVASYSVTAAHIILTGALECGTEHTPFPGTLNITLIGDKPSVASSFAGGDKSVVVLEGGRIDLHGAKLVSWTRLAAQVTAGDTQIQLTDPVDWGVGDTVVVATTFPKYDKRYLTANEVRVIAAISGDRQTLTFDQPLNYTHLSETHDLTFGGGSPLLLRKRAEVGLLRGRNIIIQGDAATASSQFGAHVIILHGARAYVSGVELFRVGQKAVLGRYPFHWHVLGDIPSGQYIKNSSISTSYNRCITVHGTNNTVVSNNICYNVIGHAYFLETGVEVGNLFDGNLGILAIRPTIAEALIPSDVIDGPHAYGPSIFWISNPSNTFINNVAVSTQGTGYWYQLESYATGIFSGSDYAPNTKPFGTFLNNMAHSLTEGITTCSYSGSVHGPNTPNHVWPISGITIYGTYIGLWPCGTPQLYENAVVVEAEIGLQTPVKTFFNNVAWVNYLDGATTKPARSTGVFLYDSGWAMKNVMFQNYDAYPKYSVFRIVSGTDFDVGTRISNVTLRNSYSLYTDGNNETYEGLIGEWGALVNDLDGTLTGQPESALTTGHPMVADDRCKPLNSKFGTVCPYRYAEPRLLFDSTGLPQAIIGRYNYSNVMDQASSTYFPPSFWPLYRWSAIANTDHVFTFKFPNTTATLYAISLQPYSRYMDTVAIEVHDVQTVTSVTGATLGRSCEDVISSKTKQKYFWDKYNNKFCVRMVATQGPTLSNPFSYQSYISLSATNSTLTTPPPFVDSAHHPSPLPSLLLACLLYILILFNM